jgi:hypothetical protein
MPLANLLVKLMSCHGGKGIMTIVISLNKMYIYFIYFVPTNRSPRYIIITIFNYPKKARAITGYVADNGPCSLF